MGQLNEMTCGLVADKNGQKHELLMASLSIQANNIIIIIEKACIRVLWGRIKECWLSRNFPYS